MATPTPHDAAPSDRPRWQRWALRGVFAILAAAVLSTPWWGPQSLAKLDYFRIAKVEFDGVRFVNPSELVQQLALDSTASIWNDLDQLAARVAKHPMVLSAEVTRTLPSTVVVTIVERLPVALVSDSGTLSPVDAAGRILPIDPARKSIDVPIVGSADTTVLRFLDGLRADDPRMYERLIEMRRVGRHELRLQLKGVTVRALDDLTVDRLSDILLVEKSLADQNQRVVELDLRFQDQVIARTP